MLEGTTVGARVRAAGPWACSLLHGLAIVALFGLTGGSEAEPDLLARARHVADHRLLWAGCWAVWSVAAISLCGFYAWWAASAPSSRLANGALVTVGLGLCCDLFGESLYAAWLPGRATALLAAGGVGAAAEQFLAIQQTATMATALLANGCYTLAGILLTLCSPMLPPWLKGMAWVIWLAGIAMSVSALVGSVSGLIASSALLFPLLVLFCPLLARALE